MCMQVQIKSTAVHVVGLDYWSSIAQPFDWKNNISERIMSSRIQSMQLSPLIRTGFCLALAGPCSSLMFGQEKKRDSACPIGEIAPTGLPICTPTAAEIFGLEPRISTDTEKQRESLRRSIMCFLRRLFHSPFARMQTEICGSHLMDSCDTM